MTLAVTVKGEKTRKTAPVSHVYNINIIKPERHITSKRAIVYQTGAQNVLSMCVGQGTCYSSLLDSDRQIQTSRELNSS